MKLQEELLPLSRKVLGPEHPETISAMHNLANYYQIAGRRDEALKLREEVLTLRRKVNGPEHPDTLKALVNLADSYTAAGRRDEALKLLEEALTLSRKVNGPEHPDTLKALNKLSYRYLVAGRKDKALKLSEEALTLYRKIYGLEHPNTLATMGNLAVIYRAVDRNGEALALLEDLVPLSRKVRGAQHPDTLKAMRNLSYSLNDLGFQLEPLGKTKEAIDVWRRAIELYPKLDTNAPYYLGILLEPSGNMGEAFAAYLLAIRNGAMGDQASARIQHMLKDQKNLGVCMQAVKSKPEIAAAAIGILTANGYLDEAARLITELPQPRPKGETIDAWRRAIELNPNLDNSAPHYLGVLLEKTGNLEEAVTAYLLAIQNGAMGDEASAKIQQIFKDPKNLDICMQAVKSKPELAVVAISIFAAHLPHEEAIKLIAELLELRPNAPDAYSHAAWLLATIPDADGHFPHAKQAVTWARQANELEPDNANWLNTLGVALYRNEQWQEASDTLQESIKLGSDGPCNWLFLAMAHVRLNQKPEAAKWYDKSLAWKQANAAALKQDSELRNFFAEAAKMMKAAAVDPSPSDPGQSSTPDQDATEKPVDSPGK